jgi:hypothetical protein
VKEIIKNKKMKNEWQADEVFDLFFCKNLWEEEKPERRERREEKGEGGGERREERG